MWYFINSFLRYDEWTWMSYLVLSVHVEIALLPCLHMFNSVSGFQWETKRTKLQMLPLGTQLRLFQNWLDVTHNILILCCSWFLAAVRKAGQLPKALGVCHGITTSSLFLLTIWSAICNPLLFILKGPLRIEDGTLSRPSNILISIDCHGQCRHYISLEAIAGRIRIGLNISFSSYKSSTTKLILSWWRIKERNKEKKAGAGRVGEGKW